MYLVSVYVTNASLNINRPFTYLSDIEIEKFIRVKVTFNHADNIAIVVDCKYSDKDIDTISQELGYKVLYINEIVDEKPIISEEIYDLAFWLAKITISPFISCLNTMLPKYLKTRRSIDNPRIIKRINKLGVNPSLTTRQKEVYELLNDGISLTQANKISSSIIKKLIDLNCIEIYEEELEYINKPITTSEFKELTDDQKNVYNQLLNTDKKVSLLYGVTGSGKTEVYLHLAKHFLAMNKEVLILVPEISLTPQMIARVKERFNDVIFYHSRLSDQERYEQYQRVKQGEVKIVVGTRSSIFLPFNDLGIIIIDEEHDSSYKQDSTPCYHVKNVAIKRAIHHNCKVLLASATPSLDSFARASKNEYKLLQLKNRINLKLPEIEIVDLNEELKQRHSYILSDSLKSELNITLNNNKQAIILLNRRGYSPILKCNKCSKVIMCEECDCSLNYHKDENVLKCHQCGKTYPVYKKCPYCGNDHLIYYGFGTKKVEEELSKLYPNARIERMDRDSVSKKDSYERILNAFQNKEIDILIGTQMIAKGLDYPDVTLVGILNADAGLMHQDYNSAKLTFDLLMQAAGRSGRADSMGKVIIQAFNVDHYAINAVLNQDYLYFYNIEMNYRHKANYPPYSHFLQIIASDTNVERLNKSINYLYDYITKLDHHVYKPLELARIKGLHRIRILIVSKNIVDLLNQMHILVDDYLKINNHSRIKIDVDPLYLE